MQIADLSSGPRTARHQVTQEDIRNPEPVEGSDQDHHCSQGKDPYGSSDVESEYEEDETYVL